MIRSTFLFAALLVSTSACKQHDPLYCGTPPGMVDPMCGFENSDGGLADGYVRIGGTVSGLNGSGLVLVNSGADDEPIATSGHFAFSTPVPLGTAYDVTVSTQPTNPSETCTVTNGSGTANADVSNIDVTCVPATYSVGGQVVGMTVGSIVLTNNGGDDTMPITSNGPFTFATQLPSNAPYNVLVKTATGGAVCTPIANVGTIGGGPVTTVVINCDSTKFTVGGTPPNGGLSGLLGTVKLKNNNADEITLNTNGAFAFPTLQNANAPYSVTVSQQPAYPPAAQNCTLVGTTGMGNVNGNVVTVKVTCATKSFTVGGNVSGLTTGTLVLKNGADTKSITADGAFTFPTPVTSGGAYSVTVMSQPASLNCRITAGSGAVMNNNVTNVSVTCLDAGTKCGGTYCTGGQLCCDPGGTPTCAAMCMPGKLKMACDDKADCSMNNLCCAKRHNGNLDVQDINCQSSCSNVSNPVQLCDPSANECGGGTSCQPWTQINGYFVCQ